MLACPKCGSVFTREHERCGLDGERLVETSADPLIGRTIDRYRIDAAIGDGGMARVYRAHHVYLAQDFAIKVLFGEVASDRALARRFQREAQASSRIRHPNVVQISDFGETPEGLIFMAMELLRGRTLSDLVREEGALPPARAAYLLRQLASGLAAAHALGSVHRDQKPKNVMLVGEPGHELAKILDFGLVLFTERSGIETSSLTQQGQVFGTPAYMAPEQVSGTDVGPAADLYALGVILHQLLRGVVPFNGTPAQVAVQHVSAPPPLLEDFAGLGPLAARCLQKKPEDRPASATAIIDLIDELNLTTLRPPDATSQVPMLAKASTEVGGARSSTPSSDLPRTPSVLTRASGPERPRSVTQPIDGAPPAPVDRALGDAREEPHVVLAVAIDDGHTPGDLGGKLAIESSHGSLPPVSLPIGGSLHGRPDATPRDDAANFDEAAEAAGVGRGRLASQLAKVAIVVALLGAGLWAYGRFAGAPETSAIADASVATIDAGASAIAGDTPDTGAGAAADDAGEVAAAGAASDAGAVEASVDAGAVDASVGGSSKGTDGGGVRARVSGTLNGEGTDAGARRARRKKPDFDPEAPRVELSVFRARDEVVTTRLAKRGLGWRDLSLTEPELAKEWALWRISAARPSAEELRWVEAQLVEAIDGVRIDARLLEQKLDRVRASLNGVPEGARDARYEALMARYQEAAHALGRRRDLTALAAQLTGLEADAASFAARAGDAAPR